MKMFDFKLALVCGAIMLWAGKTSAAEDWPQWRGPHRDGQAAGFSAPASWPAELAQKWKVKVGAGDATPALVGDKIYVFARQGGQEALLCLDAIAGKEIWRSQYDTLGATGPASGHAGPRSSPAVAHGKVVTLGVRGVLSCFDAASGKRIWRRDDFKGVWPRFFTASSPLVVDELCVAQLGGAENGGIVAYDLNSGEPKWKYDQGGTGYASPAAATIDGVPMIVTLTEKNVVALDRAGGSLLWQTPFRAAGMSYNAATPIVQGNTIVFSGAGRGATAVELEKQGGRFTGKTRWHNPRASVQFDSPVLDDGFLYGISQRGELFCLNAQNGQTTWTASTGERGGFGSIVAAGPVLLALTPSADLIVFQADGKEYNSLAHYRVAGSATYAYPVVAGNRIYVKDQDSLALWQLP